jgi:uncharacterized protein (DUF433 family)
MTVKAIPLIPDELWANLCPALGWLSSGDPGDILCWTSRVEAEAEQGTGETSHRVGVSPARLADAEARIAALEALLAARDTPPDRLVFDLNVSESSPVVRGTWITVAQVVGRVVDGWSWSEILRGYPELTEEDIRACLDYESQPKEPTEAGHDPTDG